MKLFGHHSKILFFVLGLGLIFQMPAHGIIVTPDFPTEGVLEPDNRGAINPNLDYERFTGRVSDKDQSSRILKVQVENNNTKFFRSGDLAYFKVNLKKSRNYCKGFVRSVEDFYFTIYVETFSPCYSTSEYFRRGTVLNFYSPILAQRVYEATKFREQIIVKKDDFMKQLNDINNFLWTFDQQKVKVASDYDERINELQREKRKALDDMISLKQERLVLQNELKRRLDEMDGSLKYYRVERQELMTDRWNMDHDKGLPFPQRPIPMKEAPKL